MMTSSQIIREAMKYLPRYKLICVAIDKVLLNSIKHLPIKKDIRSRMEGHYTLESWLLANGHVEKLPEYGSKEMQEYRLRWMEHLAQEYESKGD